MTLILPAGLITYDYGRLEGYPDGPWIGEPDKAQWVDPTTNLDCMINRGPTGAWCGYVGVPFEHSLHGADSEDVSVFAHGGLNYSALCEEDHPEGICHVPAPGRPDDVWWLGFACVSLFDLAPVQVYAESALAAIEISDPHELLFGEVVRSFRERMTYRDMEYVIGETTHLAEQLAQLA